MFRELLYKIHYTQSQSNSYIFGSYEHPITKFSMKLYNRIGTGLTKKSLQVKIWLYFAIQGQMSM